MSKLETKLTAFLELKAKRGQDRQDFLNDLVDAIDGLSDDDFALLDKDAVDWFNAACDAVEKKKDIPDFPAEEAAPTTSRRGRGASTKEADGPYEPKVDDEVKAKSKRGTEYTGVVVEVNDELLVIDTGGKEEELNRSRLESVTLISGASGSDKSEPADPVKVGNAVTIKSKRGIETTGKLVEIDGDVLVLETADGDKEFNRDRIDTITLAAEAKDEPKTSRRGGAKADNTKTDAKEEPKTSHRGDGGVTGRFKVLLAEGLKKDGVIPSKDSIAKQCEKEKLDFKPATLDLVYSSFAGLIDIMKEVGLLNLK